MQQTDNNNSTYFDEEINFLELFKILLEGKWIIVSLSAFVSIVSVIYSLSLPNIYESKALLAPINTSSGISGALEKYGSLASLAGINLPSGPNENSTEKALKKIVSLSFFENNLLKNIYLPDLFAVKSWDPKTNTLTYDKNIYDLKTSTWIRDYSFPQQQIPSAQESFEVFIQDHLNLIEDQKSGFIILSIKHQSPYIAKQWVELIVNEVNEFYRQRDKLESEKAISYLNKQFSTSGYSEIKQVLALLIQEETKKLTLVEANQLYIFDYIDPPALMEKKSEPIRSLIIMLGTLLGLIMSILIVFVRNYIGKKF